MPETIKQEALQLEPLLESYEACNFSHTFPVEKPFNYSPLKYPVRDVLVVKRANVSISNNKRPTFSSLMVKCLLKDTSKGTVNIAPYIEQLTILL